MDKCNLAAGGQASDRSLLSPAMCSLLMVACAPHGCNVGQAKTFLDNEPTALCCKAHTYMIPGPTVFMVPLPQTQRHKRSLGAKLEANKVMLTGCHCLRMRTASAMCIRRPTQGANIAERSGTCNDYAWRFLLTRCPHAQRMSQTAIAKTETLPSCRASARSPRANW